MVSMRPQRQSFSLQSYTGDSNLKDSIQFVATFYLDDYFWHTNGHGEYARVVQSSLATSEFPLAGHKNGQYALSSCWA